MHSPIFRHLLAATIQHLDHLRDQGARSLHISTTTLAGLAYPGFTGGLAGPNAGTAGESIKGELLSTARLDHGIRTEAPTNWRVTQLDTNSKQSAFQQLRSRVLQCGQCPHLASSRQSVVFGTGNLDSDILFVGEAPGADEDATGEPFFGKAGDLLTKIIQAMGLSREAVFIANVLKCRPDTPGKSSGNRKPTSAEMATCLPYLEDQIAIIRPKVMVALGATAIEGLIRQAPVQVTRIRGQWLQFHDIPLMPTYHPAYLLRNDSITEKRKVWEDMLAVMEKLGLPISERQRNYFLKSP